MNRQSLRWTLLFLLLYSNVFAQRTGELIGVVRDSRTQELLLGVTIQIEGTQLGTVTDVNGAFRLTGVPAGSYNLKASYIGYKPLVKYNLVVTSGNANQVTFELEEESTQLNEVKIVANRSITVANDETPNSIQRLTSEEIKTNPGGNFDISRVVQVLPGVGSTAGSVGGFRNDIIIRGGAPNENVYYLDGIEVPVINHFATQGAAGGPTGILNVSFIEDVTLSSSSFNARYDNALSSVLQFRQREGNPNRLQGNVRLSSSELATTLEGPLSSKTTFLASARRSYLQFLFQAIDLPIRPNYWDFQYKVTHKIDKKTTLNFIGIGAIDEFTFAVPRSSTPEKEYVLRAFPNINQWNYTFGVSLRRLLTNGYLNVAASRNMFDNRLDRFEDNQEGREEFRTLGSTSQEIENKLRIDVNKSVSGWDWSYGGVLQYVKYNNDFFNRFRREVRNAEGVVVSPELSIRFNSAIDFFRYGAFVQVSRRVAGERLTLSGGLRTDMNSFTDTGQNPLRTLSPRVAASYQLSNIWRINTSAGRYFKLPIYTVLGYRNEAGQLTNRGNDYIRTDHLVGGIEGVLSPTSRLTVEGFYKYYANYPVSLRDGISLANQGGDFGAVGNETVTSNGLGRAYGLEVFFQQKLVKNTFAVFSYTLFWSQFSGRDGRFIASAWDSRHLISAQVGRKLKRNWEVGMKYRFAGGAPLTPFDLETSRQQYALTGVGLLDFTQLNSQRLRPFSQVDVRIDKKWNFKRSTFDLYFDLLNAFLTRNPAFPQYTFERTADGSAFATTDGLPLMMNGANAIPLILSNEDVTFTPTIGFIVEF